MHRRALSLRWGLLVAGVLVASLAGCGGLHRALAVAPNLVSHQLCSAVFVAGLDPQSYYRDAIVPDLAFFEPWVFYDVDRVHQEVTANFAGVLASRAVFRGDEGCLVVQGPENPPAAFPAPAAAPVLPPIAGAELVPPASPALAAALDHAFADTDACTPCMTHAVIVVHRGQIVAERYAQGFGIDTPMHGWSLTKSVTNALVGILVREGKLSPIGPAPVAAWGASADPRHAISIEHLLRMNSGLDFGESLHQSWSSAFDPTVQMVFASPDMASLPERAPLEAKPGEHWRYSNGNTMLLSRIVRDAVGGDAQSVLNFVHRELFDKMGMARVTLEFDATGTPIGASHMWAPARDWARFGMLFLDDGVVAGERLLPEGWVDESARLTPGSEDYGYGAGFWTNRGEQRAARLHRPGMPRDSFMARGSLGQYVIVAPSENLVIVRLGTTRTPREGIESVDQLTAEALAALKNGQ